MRPSFGELDGKFEAEGRKGPARTQDEADAYHEAQQAVIESNERKRAGRLADKARRKRKGDDL